MAREQTGWNLLDQTLFESGGAGNNQSANQMEDGFVPPPAGDSFSLPDAPSLDADNPHPFGFPAAGLTTPDGAPATGAEAVDYGNSFASLGNGSAMPGFEPPSSTDTWEGGTGNWTTAKDWSDGVPTSTSDVVISTSNADVTLNTGTTVNSITIGKSGATLDIENTGGTDTVSTTFSNSGTLYLDNDNGNGGSNLTVDGTFTNSGSVYVGNSDLSGATTISLGSLVNNSGATFEVQGSASHEATLDFTGGNNAFTANAGTFELYYAAPLTLGASFTNTGSMSIDNDSSLTITGNFANTSGVDGAYGTLDIYNDSKVTITGNFTNNSGVLDIENGSTLTINGSLINTNDGLIYVDNSSGPDGSSLTFAGTLTNEDDSRVYFGNSNPGASETFSLAGLTNASGSTFSVEGSASHEATLDFTGGDSAFTANAGTFELYNVTPLTLNTAFNNSGDIYLTNTNLTITGALTNTGTISDNYGTLTLDGFAGGSNGGTIEIQGNSASHEATLDFTGGNNAFTANAGTFELYYAAPLTLGASFTNTGSMSIDNDSSLTITGNFANTSGVDGAYGILDIYNDSKVTITGNFTNNSGVLDIENGSTLTINGSLINTNDGIIYVDHSSGSDGSSLTLAGTLTNEDDSSVYFGNSNPGASESFSLAGLTNDSGSTFSVTGSASHEATLDFTGGASSFTANAGNFELYYVTPLTLSTAFNNSGTIETSYTNLTITGALTNTGTISDNYGTLTLDGFAGGSNGGTIEIQGNSASQEATIDFTGGAGSFTSNTGTFELSYATPLTITGNFANTSGVDGAYGILDIYNDSKVTITGNFTNNSGVLDIENGSTLTINGSLINTNDGIIYVDHSSGSDGSSLTLAGTLTNEDDSSVYFGNSNPGASESFSLAGLTNDSGSTFSVTGSASHEATLDFTGGASSFTANAGNFELYYVTPLTLSTAFNNSGTIETSYTNLTITGALTNTGTISDNYGTLTLDGFAGGSNGGTIEIQGNSASQEATIDFTGGAGSFTSNTGTFELSYATPLTITGNFANTSGVDGAYGILDIYNDSKVTITGNFTNNSGVLDIENGSTLTINGSLINTNTGIIYVDHSSGSDGSSLTFAGTLTNEESSVYFGNSNPGASESFSLAGLTNDSGSTFSVTGSASHEATLDFTGGASSFTANAGNFELYYVTPLTLSTAFNNSGTIETSYTNLTITGALTNTGTISDNYGTLTLDGFAGGSNGGTIEIQGNSASQEATIDFTGGTGSFTSNAGSFDLNYATPLTLNTSFTNTGYMSIDEDSSLTITGNFTNSSAIYLDTSGSSGGSSLTIEGTLTNDDYVNVGSTSLSADTTVTLGGYSDSSGAELSVTGKSASLIATVDITGTATVTAEIAIAKDGTVNFSGTESAISGTISGAGTLEFTGGSQAIDSGASITVSNWTISNGDAASLNENLTYNGTFSDGSGTTLSIAAGDTLTLKNASATFAGAVSGAGTLAFYGGTETLAAGASLGSTNLSITNSASVSVTGNASDSSDTSFASGTTVSIGTGDTFSLSGTGSTIADTISGAGTLAFTGGSQAINSGASLTVSNWTTSNGDAASVNENLTYAGTFSEGSGTTLSIASGDTLTFTGGAGFAGAVSGSATLVLSGGADSFGDGANLGASTLSITNGASITVTGNASDSSDTSLASGTTIAIESGDTLSLSGAGSTFVGTVSGAGTLAFTGGSQAIDSGASLTVSNWSTSNGDAAALNESLNYAGTFTEDSSSTLAIASGDTLSLSGTGSSIAGTISGAATLAFAGGSQTLDSGANLTVSDWTLSNSDAAMVNGNVGYGGTFSEDSSSTLSVASGDTFTLTGSTTINGATAGAGILSFSDDSVTLGAGASLGSANLVISNGATVSVNGNVSDSSDTSQAGGTTISIGSGDTLTLSGAGSSLAGTISGAGTLAFAGGSQALNSGASLTVSNWSLSNGDAATVNENLGYGGTFSEDATSTLSIASGDTLTFTGGATFAGTVSGAGTLALSGDTVTLGAGASLGSADLTIGNGASVNVNGNASDSSDTTQANGTTISIGTGDTLSLSGTGSSIAGTISGAGTLAFAGGSQAFNSGASITVSNWTTSNGDAASINENLSYAGSFSDGAGTTLSISSGETLTLNGSAAFAGTVSGAGTLALSGGSDTLGAGANLSSANLTISNGAAVTVNGNASDSSDTSQASGTTISIDSGDTLSLSGAGSTIAGTISGAGTLAFAGGSQALNSGASLTVSDWTLSNGDSTSVNENLSYGGTFSEDSSSTLSIASGDTFTLSGGATLAGTISGAGTLAFSGGSQSLNNGASLTVSGWNVSNGAAVSVNESLSYAGAFSEDSTSTLSIASGDVLTLSGTAALAGAMAGAGTLTFSGGSQALNSGASLTVADWVISNSDAVSINENLGYGGALSEDSTSALSIASGDTLTLSGTGSIIAGTISGAGTLALAGGSQAFNAGAALTIANWTMSNGDAASINENLSYAGTLSEGSGAALSIASGDMLSLNGSATLAGTISGAGTLAFAGGSQTLDSGATLTVADWTMSNGDAVTVNENLGYGGTFSQGAGTTVSVASGDTLSLSGTDSSISGTISGAGTLAFSGGSQALNSGASLTIADWTMSNGDAASVNENLGYAGTFSEGSGTTLSIAAGDTLTLTGASTLDGSVTLATGATLDFDGSNSATFALSGATIGGTGTVELDNGTLNVTATTFGGAVNLDGGTLALNGGTVVVDGALNNGGGAIALNAGELSLDGGGSSSVSSFSLASGTTLDFGGGSFTLSGGGTLGGAGTTVELDNGTLDVTSGTTFGGALNVTGGVLEFGAGTSEVAGLFTNNGSVVLQSGQLDVNGGVTGTGTVTVDSGTTFQLNASATTAANYVDIASGMGMVDLTGGSGDDVFAFGGNFQASDVINGGGGNDTLILDGDYSAGLTFGKTTMVNVENITLDNGYSYDLTLNKTTVAKGQTLTVDASSLGAGDTLTFNGGKSDGNLVIYGSTGGHDVLTGGKGANVFVGDGNGDSINCKNGTDIVVYNQASDSTSTGFDTVSKFNAASDQFSVFSQVTNIDAKYHGGTLDASNFDADLTADLAGRLTADGAILYKAKSGSYAGDLFLVIDQNGQAGYQAGQDLVIEVPHFKGTLSTSDFLLDYVPGVPETQNHAHGSHTAGHAHGINLPESFDWDAIFAASGHQGARPHIANPLAAAAQHQNGLAGIHDGTDGFHSFGHHDASYHSQLDALWFDGGHGALTEQFSLPHTDYFGS